MLVNKYDIAHGIRTIALGLLVIGLLPTPLFFSGPVHSDSVNGYGAGLLSLLGIALVSQVFVARYRVERNTTDTRKKAEKIYSVIGLSIIGLFFIAIVVMWLLGNQG